jgi:hypothetical protein
LKTSYPIPLKKIKPSLEFYDEVIKMNLEAEEYINGFKWCKQIKEAHLYYNLGSTLCVFLFNIYNIQSTDEADNVLWIIVGDLPSMYLDTYNIKSLKEALENYAELGGEWADNIITKKSVKDCFPFDEKPSLKLAKLLKSRVEFIRSNLLDNIEDIKLAI